MELREFFMPAISDSHEAETMYNAIKQLNEKDNYEISEKRIYSISYNHNGIERTDTVGLECFDNGEIVIAIFETGEDLYYTITKSRGLHAPDPLYSKPNKVVYFRDANVSDSTI